MMCVCVCVHFFTSNRKTLIFGTLKRPNILSIASVKDIWLSLVRSEKRKTWTSFFYSNAESEDYCECDNLKLNSNSKDVLKSISSSSSPTMD